MELSGKTIASLQPKVSPGRYNVKIQANEIKFENCSAEPNNISKIHIAIRFNLRHFWPSVPSFAFTVLMLRLCSVHGTTCSNDFSRNNVGNTLQVFDWGSKTRNLLPSEKLREKSSRVTCYTVFDFSQSLLQVVVPNTAFKANGKAVSTMMKPKQTHVAVQN